MKLLQLPFWDFFKSLWGEEYQSYFDNESYWMTAFMIFIAAVLVSLIAWGVYGWVHDMIDNKRSTKEVLEGELIDKVYIGSQSSSGTGTAIIPNTNGGVGIGVVSTSSYSAEQFLFFIKANNRIYKVPVSMEHYYQGEVGIALDFEITIGGLTRNILKIELL
jgi:hypothetical protein